jgi:hypothetical protein
MRFLSFEFNFGVLLNYHTILLQSTIRRDTMGGQLWVRPPCSGMLSIASKNDICVSYVVLQLRIRSGG